jgi:hypothetical protein
MHNAPGLSLHFLAEETANPPTCILKLAGINGAKRTHACHALPDSHSILT